MIKRILLIFFLSIISYLNLSAQRSNGGRYSLYKSLLTEEDINQLRQGKEVYLNFSDEEPKHTEKGIVRVIPTINKGEYNFVEIGDWIIDYAFKFSNSNKGLIKCEYT